MNNKNIFLNQFSKPFFCLFITFLRPDGWIYEKEAILEYILHKKMENAKLMKQFEKQKDNKKKELHELAEIEQKEKIEKFLKSEGKLVTSSLSSAAVASSSSESGPSGSANSDSKSMLFHFSYI